MNDPLLAKINSMIGILTEMRKERAHELQRDKIHALIEEMCKKLNVSQFNIYSAIRVRKITDSRSMIMHELHRLGFRKFHIARALNLDHATVIYNLNKYDSLYGTDGKFTARANKLKDEKDNQSNR